MHILLTTPYLIWPVNYGSAVCTTQLGRQLASIGHQVTLLSAGEIDPASIIGKNAR